MNSFSTSPSPSSASSTATQAPPVLRAESIVKTFRSGPSDIHVLSGIDLSLSRGEFISIIGPSGSGKSTLLHLLGALDTPTTGIVFFDGRALQSFNETELADFRNRRIGFVWQRHHLLPDFSAAENVAIPLLIQQVPRARAIEAARGWLAEVGLAHRAEQFAGALSGGEQQRVAIARALVTNPQVLLADEPTGDLDERNAESVFALMRTLHRSHNLASILATHNLSLAGQCDRVLELEHGLLAPRSLAGMRTSAP